MKYGITLGRTGYVKHMHNLLLTSLGDGNFSAEVLFEGVPVQYTFDNTGIERSPEYMTPEDWDVLCEMFDAQTRQMVRAALEKLVEASKYVVN